jgi:hypothetical protein
LIALSLISALLLSVTACATSHASVTTFIATPAGRQVMTSPLTLSRVKLDSSAFNVEATTNTDTYLAPFYNVGPDEMGPYCIDQSPENWAQLATQGGLGTLSAHSHVRVLGHSSTDPVRDPRMYATVLTDDGFVGDVCYYDLSFGS